MERVKKTDQAVKTAESWWAFLFAEGSLGQTIVKWVWPVIAAGIFGYAAKISDWVGQFGPIGWVTAAGVGFALGAFSLAQVEGFRLRRSQRLRPEDAFSRTSEGDEIDIASLIDTRLNEFLATTLRAEFAKHSDVHAHDQKLADLAQKTSTAQGSAQIALDYTKKEIARLDARVGEIAKGCHDMERQWSDWTASHCRSQDQRFQNVDGGFGAIWHRELLGEMEGRIESEAAWLLRPKSGEKIDNWGAWSHRKGEWESLLREWATLATIYREGCAERVQHVPHHRLIGDWPEDDSLFPNSDAATAYRAASVVFDNFIGERSLVHRALESAAFQSPSKKGRGATDEHH